MFLKVLFSEEVHMYDYYTFIEAESGVITYSSHTHNTNDLRHG